MPDSESMANPRATQLKRQRESMLAGRRKEKEAKRQAAKERRVHTPTRGPGGEDPDIAGIVPGPQPRDEDGFLIDE